MRESNHKTQPTKYQGGGCAIGSAWDYKNRMLNSSFHDRHHDPLQEFDKHSRTFTFPKMSKVPGKHFYLGKLLVLTTIYSSFQDIDWDDHPAILCSHRNITQVVGSRYAILRRSPCIKSASQGQKTEGSVYCSPVHKDHDTNGYLSPIPSVRIERRRRMPPLKIDEAEENRGDRSASIS